MFETKAPLQDLFKRLHFFGTPDKWYLGQFNRLFDNTFSATIKDSVTRKDNLALGSEGENILLERLSKNLQKWPNSRSKFPKSPALLVT